MAVTKTTVETVVETDGSITAVTVAETEFRSDSSYHYELSINCSLPHRKLFI